MSASEVDSMARLYSKLRGLMREFGDTQDDVARALLLSRISVSNRLRGTAEWKLGEMYALMDRYHVPHDRLHEVFPKDGRNEYMR